MNVVRLAEKKVTTEEQTAPDKSSLALLVVQL